MKGTLKKNGHYELLQSTKGQQILNLNNQEFYLVVESQQGDTLVYSESNQTKGTRQEEGNFYLAEFENDSEIQDFPHLLLESSEIYREFLLPNGLPTKSDHRKKLIRTEERVSHHVPA